MLASHPANLLLRFTLEIVALVSLGQWAWRASEGIWRYVFGIGLPLLMAALWGIFAVPDDPSRGGKPLAPISGRLRLAMEGAFFTMAALAMLNRGQLVLAGAFVVAVLLHYFLSVERIVWLRKH